MADMVVDDTIGDSTSEMVTDVKMEPVGKVTDLKRMTIDM